MTLEKSARTVKLLFKCFIAVFFISGCVLEGVGIWSLVEFFPYEPLSSSVHFAKASKLLIIAGFLNVLVSFFGCWRSRISKENSRFFIFFFLVLLVVLGLVISAAAVGFQNRDKVRDTLSDDVLHVIRDVYGIKTEPSSAIRDLQIKGECCGWFNYTDWRQSWFTHQGNDSIVPDSCCKDRSERYTHMYRCGENFTIENIYTRGCRGVFLLQLVRDTLYVVANTAVIATIIQVLGVLFVSIALSYSFKRLDEKIPLWSRTARI